MKTKYHCDCVEFCSQSKDLFVCGNYELIEKEKIKVGCLYLMKVIAWNESNNNVEKYENDNYLLTDTSNFVEIQSFQTSAILDVKWSGRQILNKSLLGIVFILFEEII
jgi:hypothetical protein